MLLSLLDDEAILEKLLLLELSDVQEVYKESPVVKLG